MRRGLAMLVPGLSIYGLRLKRATDGYERLTRAEDSFAE
jgi:hypothetical protein